MILNDKEIKEAIETGDLDITPFFEQNINSVSYDLSLSGIKSLTNPEHDVSENDDSQGIIEIMPHETFLAGSIEKIKLSDHISGFVMAKSSTFRKGLILGSSGLVDPGYNGTITVLLANTTQKSIKFRYTQRFVQIQFIKVNPVENSYNGRYQGSNEIAEAKPE